MPTDIIALIDKVEEEFEAGKTKKDVAILFADMSSSTSMKIELSKTDAWRNVLIHNNICESSITKNNGKVIKHIGDGIMSRFDLEQQEQPAQIMKIINCAIEIQKHINKDGRFATKISLHICKAGEAFELNNNDLIGFPVDVAARINEISKRSQILISEDVYSWVFQENNEDIGFNGPFKRIIRGTKEEIKIFEVGYILNEQSSHVYYGVESENRVKKVEEIGVLVGKLDNDINGYHKEILNLHNESQNAYSTLNKFNILEILEPARIPSSKTKTFVDDYLIRYLENPFKEKKTIKAYGIALTKLFSTDASLRNILLETKYKGELDFRAIILDPDSPAAETRSFVESAGKCAVDISKDECVVHKEITASLESIKNLTERIGSEYFKVKTTHFLPQMWFLMTDEVLFFEQYHIGKPHYNTIEYKCLGGTVPTIQTGNKSYWYEYFVNQFNFLWSIEELDKINKYFKMKKRYDIQPISKSVK